jgi:hypothetical protein
LLPFLLPREQTSVIPHRLNGGMTINERWRFALLAVGSPVACNNRIAIVLGACCPAGATSNTYHTRPQQPGQPRWTHLCANVCSIGSNCPNRISRISRRLQ